MSPKTLFVCLFLSVCFRLTFCLISIIFEYLKTKIHVLIFLLTCFHRHIFYKHPSYLLRLEEAAGDYFSGKYVRLFNLLQKRIILRIDRMLQFQVTYSNSSFMMDSVHRLLTDGENHTQISIDKDSQTQFPIDR